LILIQNRQHAETQWVELANKLCQREGWTEILLLAQIL